jgi:hypothetical protein
MVLLQLCTYNTQRLCRYANRAKNIKNKPKINEDPKDAMLREFQEEIRRLKLQLANQEEGGGSGNTSGKHIIYVDGEPVEVSHSCATSTYVLQYTVWRV